MRPPAPERQLALPPFQQQERCPIVATAREFVDYWIENSTHASEAHGAVGAEQGVSILTARCVEMASIFGFSKTALDQQVGNLASVHWREARSGQWVGESARRDERCRLTRSYEKEVDRGGQYLQ